MKLSNLAIFGAPPQFSSPLHVGGPNIGDRNSLMRRIDRILSTRWLTNNGPMVQEFEQKIASLTGVKHCIAICNATVALQIAIRALDLAGEVIVPSFTFVATAHALQWEGVKPVFCDVNDEYLIDPRQVEKLITPRTTGIIGVHLWGRACDVKALSAIAKRHRLKLLFDAAHSFGCSDRAKMIGNFGDAEVFSFHATKFLNTAEGGAIVTNNHALASKIRLMNNFGFAGYDRVIYLGTNGKMNEFNAALGLTNLEKIKQIIQINRNNYVAYKRYLKGVKGVSLLPYDKKEKSNYQYVVVIIDQKKSGIDRNSLLKVLEAENILARRYFYPGCHKMEPYRSTKLLKRRLFPVTEKACDEVMCLPTGEAVSSRSIQKICTIIKAAAANGSEIVDRLRFLPKENL